MKRKERERIELMECIKQLILQLIVGKPLQ